MRSALHHGALHCSKHEHYKCNTRKENDVLQFCHTYSYKTYFLAIHCGSTMRSKGSIQSSPSGPPGLLRVGAKPCSLGEVAMAISHEGWLSAQVDTPGWSMRKRTSVEPRGERVDSGNSTLGIEREKRRFGVDVKISKGVGSFDLTCYLKYCVK